MSRINSSIGSIGDKEEKISKVELNDLINLGTLEERVKIGDKTFKISTLNIQERQNLAKYSKEYQPENDSEIFEDFIWDFNTTILAFCVHEVNDTPLEQLHPNYNGNNGFECRKEIFLSMQPIVVARLIEKYLELKNKSEQNFQEDVKN